MGMATSLRTKLLKLESVGGNIFQWRSPALGSQQILTLLQAETLMTAQNHQKCRD